MLTFKGKDGITSIGSIVNLLNLKHENVYVVYIKGRISRSKAWIKSLS